MYRLLEIDGAPIYTKTVYASKAERTNRRWYLSDVK
jgi:hypothetical protein